MSFLNKLFQKESDSQLQSFWNELSSEADLENAIEKSNENKVVLFKHSTRCFISKTVLSNFEKEVNQRNPTMDFYYLDLLQHRDLSNKIANDFKVEHQSPQILVLENGIVIHHASHSDISLKNI